MHQLIEMVDKTKYIKEEFKKIEAQEWTAKEFGTELVVQVGHLADIMLRQSAKYNNYTIDENNKHLGDELSDVLLNTFSVVETSGLSSKDLINNIQEKTIMAGPQPQLFEEVVRGAYEMFSLTRGEELDKGKILDVASSLTVNSLALGSYMELDLPRYFGKMIEESKIFIDQKAQKIIDSYPYKIPRIKLLIEESALPFAEKPKSIELLKEKPLPFLLLRSSAFPWVKEIRNRIIDEGFTVDHERETDEFELLARHLYPASKDKEETYLWFLISRKAFPESYNKGYAFVLSSEDIARYSDIDSLKRRIRVSIGPTPFEIQYRGKKILTDLHHIHAPDEKDCQIEYPLLVAFSKRVDLR
jgi:hypothetical protein